MSLIPKNDRVKIDPNAHWRIWLYGESYTGKTYLANKFPNVLMLNSDGNTDEVDAPRIRIANQYEQNGRVMNEIPAWKYFKSVIAELRKNEEGYETIVLDLIEDFYEFCRQYVCKEILHVNHESDANFKAWDMVRTEFYSVIRDLFSLPYNFILISQEDKSRDIMERSGDKFTAIRPNITDKVALKLAGMCTITARVMMKGKEQRVISFKTSDVVFGGGRIQIPAEEIPCDYEPLINILENAQVIKPSRDESKLNAPLEGISNHRPEPQPEPQPIVAEEPTPTATYEQTEEQPKRRRRRTVADDNYASPEITVVPSEGTSVSSETVTVSSDDTSVSSETVSVPESEDSVSDKVSPIEFGIASPEESAPVDETPKTEEPPRRRRRRVVEDDDADAPF